MTSGKKKTDLLAHLEEARTIYVDALEMAIADQPAFQAEIELMLKQATERSRDALWFVGRPYVYAAPEPGYAVVLDLTIAPIPREIQGPASVSMRFDLTTTDGRLYSCGMQAFREVVAHREAGAVRLRVRCEIGRGPRVRFVYEPFDANGRLIGAMHDEIEEIRDQAERRARALTSSPPDFGTEGDR